MQGGNVMTTRRNRIVLKAAVASAIFGLLGAAEAQRSEVVQVRELMALTYPEGPTISVKFLGTSRLPLASGEAKVERKKGMTEIEVELDEMKPSIGFGGDYNTYVLWIVSPEGEVDNVGEFILEGNRSKLNVSTPLETFGMMVSAEPHFLVGLPSRFVVLENTRPTVDMPLKVSELRYRGHAGIYRFDNESLAEVAEARGETRTHIEAARTAVALAERAGAARFARAELDKARAALESAEARYRMGASGRDEMLVAHEVIRLAVDAEKLAGERAFDSALSQERKVNADRIAELSTAIAAAKSEAERSRLEAEQKALDAEISAKAGRAAEREAAEAAKRAAEAEDKADQAERQRIVAEEAKLDAQRETVEAQRDRSLAEREAAEARLEGQKAREALREAMVGIAAVRESARGLIVSLPNILFESGRADLKPEGREALAKISGVLLITNGYRLSVEGHTDNVGSPEENLVLSRKRGESVRDYLLGQGLSPAAMTVVGFGESQPVASNETGAGRLENRRVEIVVLDLGVGPTQ
jgi:outer membrane protein OmpA-like peptidoglycan-associated protein